VVFQHGTFRDSSIFESRCAVIEDKQNELQRLCQQVSTEQDFEKVLELTHEILRLTEPKPKAHPESGVTR
jgi:transcription termination factor NusB